MESGNQAQPVNEEAPNYWKTTAQPPQAPVKKPSNKKLILIIILIIVGALIAVLAVMQFFGIESLMSLLPQGITGFRELTPSIGTDLYGTLTSQKSVIETSFNQARNYGLENINNNTELVGALQSSLGTQYSIYLFSAYYNVKVFEWTIQFSDGLITEFTEGKTKENYNAEIQLDQSIAVNVLTGSSTSDEITAYISQGKIKITPLSESVKIEGLIPAIINAIPAKKF